MNASNTTFPAYQQVSESTSNAAWLDSATRK